MSELLPRRRRTLSSLLASTLAVMLTTMAMMTATAPAEPRVARRFAHGLRAETCGMLHMPASARDLALMSCITPRHVERLMMTRIGQAVLSRLQAVPMRTAAMPPTTRLTLATRRRCST